MRTIISILILVIFSLGIASIVSCFVDPMSLFTNISVVLSGFVNIILAVELIKGIAISNGGIHSEDQEEKED